MADLPDHVKHLVGARKDVLDTPVLLLDLNALERNISKISTTIIDEAGVGWRPHTKAMKNPDLARLCLAAGAHGVTCAKLSEAEVMAAGGITDILVANEVVGMKKIDRLVDLCSRADIMVCVDDKNNVEQIDRAASAAGVRPRVLIEVDVGMGRAGVQPGTATVELASHISRFESIRFAGLQTWESHTLKITDQAEKKRQVLAALSQLNDTAERVRRAGIPVDIMSCGGTGTYWISAFAPGVTEVEAGGGIYGCVQYRKNFGVEVEPALTILSTVTSRPTGTRIICDAGFKAAGKGQPDPEFEGIDTPHSVQFSAEHGVITLSDEVLQPQVGATIEFVPGYSDAVIFLHDYLYGVRDGVVETVWPIIGRGKLQ